MTKPIRVAILDDHQAVLDGFQYRLSPAPDIEVTATLLVGEDLQPALKRQPVDVLLLDVQAPTSEHNPTPYPIQHLIPTLLEQYPNLVIAVISMHSSGNLVRLLVELGASAYILKDDRAAFIDLPAVIRLLHSGGVYFSPQIARILRSLPTETESLLTPRQLEVLSYYAAYPELSTAEVAKQLHIAHSTLRNFLSNAYLRLDVQNRAAAIAKARHLRLISPDIAPPPLADFEP